MTPAWLQGLVTTLHEGDDFGQLALVNDAPRAATIILREDNCHFLRVDKQDFNRIIKVLLLGVGRAGDTGGTCLWRNGMGHGVGTGEPGGGKARGLWPEVGAQPWVCEEVQSMRGAQRAWEPGVGFQRGGNAG